MGFDSEYVLFNIINLWSIFCFRNVFGVFLVYFFKGRRDFDFCFYRLVFCFIDLEIYVVRKILYII